MTPTLRPATPDDADDIRAIYAPIVRETAISFETDPPDAETIADRIEDKQAQYPWLVCEHEGRVVGYASASAYRGRGAYRWSAEVSVYVHPEWRRRGVARALHTSLLGVLELLGYATAVAVVALPNPESVALHESLGFEHVGTHHDIGYKHGAWHDVGHWELSVQDHGTDPPDPTPAADLRGTAEYRGAVESGAAELAR